MNLYSMLVGIAMFLLITGTVIAVNNSTQDVEKGLFTGLLNPLPIDALIPGDEQDLLVQGAAQVLNGSYEEAVETYEKVISLNETNVLPFIRISEIHAYQGNMSAAIDSIDQGLRRNMNSSLLWIQKGALLESENLTDEALNAYQMALDINPDDMFTQDRVAVLTGES